MSKRAFAAVWILICTLLALASTVSFGSLQGDSFILEELVTTCVGGLFLGWFLLSRAIGHKSNCFLATSAGIVSAFLLVPVSLMGIMLSAGGVSSDPVGSFSFMLLFSFFTTYKYGWIILVLGAISGLSSHIVWLWYEGKPSLN